MTEQEREIIINSLPFDEAQALIEIYYNTGTLPEYIGHYATTDFITPLNIPLEGSHITVEY